MQSLQFLVNLAKKYKWYIVGFFLVVFIFSAYSLISNNKSEQRVLRDTNKSLEAIIKERDSQIKDLQEQIDALKKEQELKERAITKYENKRQKITEPKSVKELKQRFRGLGYEPTN
jgi:peptidoglycan hydrolase CwlO-like protein